MQRRIALILLAGGVAVFFVSSGIFGSALPFLALVGLGCIVVGFGGFIFSLRASALSRPNAVTLAVVALGIALNAYEQVQASGAFSVGWFLWALVPYVACLVASAFPNMRVPSIAGATAVLLIDLWMYYTVANSTSSTAGLVFLFVPLWSTLVFAPLAILITWFIGRRMHWQGRKP